MTWDYRIVRRSVNGETVFAVHEAYYDAAGRVEGITIEPCAPDGTTLNALIKDLDLMRLALDQPVLDYDEIGRLKESR